MATPPESLPRSAGFSLPLLDRLGADNGRKAAIGLLALLALAQIAFGEMAWSPVRNLWFDAYQQVMPRQVTTLPAVIVDIDDESLKQFGRWPWPRTRLAQLVDASHRLGALAVGLDMILPEADSQSPQRLLAEREDTSLELRKALAALPPNDAILADTLRQVPSVLGRAALIDAAPGKSSIANQTPAVIAGAAPQRFAPTYEGQIVNLPELEGVAHGRGYLNDSRDGDGVVRSMPLVLSVNGSIAPAFAVELLRVATGQAAYSVRSDRQRHTRSADRYVIHSYGPQRQLAFVLLARSSLSAGIGGGDSPRRCGAQGACESSGDYRGHCCGHQRRRGDASRFAHGRRRDSCPAGREYSIRCPFGPAIGGALVGIVWSRDLRYRPDRGSTPASTGHRRRIVLRHTATLW